MKIAVAMIVQDAEDFIALALSSVCTFADKIVIVDGGSKDQTLDIIKAYEDERFTLLNNLYDKSDAGMDGKQRNVYLEWLKRNCDGWWCLVVDSDECVSDNAHELKNTLDEMDSQGFNLASPHMEHFIYSLKQVDATIEKHFCPHRLFKVQPGLSYPEVEHNVLQVPNAKAFNCETITLFHLGYVNNLIGVMKRFYKNLAKSNIHSKTYLDLWKTAHVLGLYPTRRYEGSFPRPMQEFFGV